MTRRTGPAIPSSDRLLDEALDEAGIDRGMTYVTNAVKHFKFVRQELTRRRLHKKPAAGEVRACHPWLEEEINAIRPALVVALGSTAAQALLGPAFRVTRERGRVIESAQGPVLATVHPSAILRAPSETRAAEQRAFVRDLTEAARWLTRATARPSRPVVGPARRSRARPSA